VFVPGTRPIFSLPARASVGRAADDPRVAIRQFDDGAMGYVLYARQLTPQDMAASPASIRPPQQTDIRDVFPADCPTEIRHGP